MPLIIKMLLYLILFSTGLNSAMSQISGVVNTYTKVLAVDYVCHALSVESTSGFAAGDKILIIQMQGASINESNAITFGNITAIGDAGNFEFGIISHFNGNDIYLNQELERTYTPSGAVQLVRVPLYEDVSIDEELSTKSWDGNTGGVIVIESSGTITLNANIDASEKGFRGGKQSAPGGDCNTSSVNTYYYSFPSIQAGQKGEGVSGYVTSRESGRAKNSTGGGGGNSHNTGGGGGANYGNGGRGGDKKHTGCSLSPNPFGYGAEGLGSTYYEASLNKIFMGGGGGGGHQNNSVSFDAANGGGIIIIKAKDLIANGYTIRSNGGNVATHYTSAVGDNGDGNSGGGAGGTVLLNLSNYSGATANIEVNGGKGGNTGYLNYNFGPGGGGGGGVIWMDEIYNNINTSVSAGAAGISGGFGQGSGTNWNATNGTDGAVLTAVAIPQSGKNSNCSLPVELISFDAKAMSNYKVQLDWTTASEWNNDFFTLEKSVDGKFFSPVINIYGKANSNQPTKYTYIDKTETFKLVYYKLTQTDIDGHSVDLGIRKVSPNQAQTIVEAYPNPFGNDLYILFNDANKQLIKNLWLANAYGESIFVPWEEHNGDIHIHTSSIPPGLYFLIVYSFNQAEIIKVVKE